MTSSARAAREGGSVPARRTPAPPRIAARAAAGRAAGVAAADPYPARVRTVEERTGGTIEARLTVARLASPLSDERVAKRRNRHRATATESAARPARRGH